MLPLDNHEELSFSEDDILRGPFIYSGSDNEDILCDSEGDEAIQEEEEISEDPFP